jgi:hypothetical protein
MEVEQKSIRNQTSFAVFKFESIDGIFRMMKCMDKIVICIAGGLALTASLRADEVVLSGNPYAPVVVRNIFGLNPVTVVTTTIFDAPLPKITANGIMSIFGQPQVLFKVDIEAWSGKPAKEQSYILTEGERQDDIEVTHIDEKTGTVTFNNHGTVQDITLVNGSASSTATSGATGINMPGAGGNNGMSGITRIGGRDYIGAGPRNRFGFQTTASPQNYTPSQQPAMSPEEQIIAIEANRELTKQQVIQGEMPPLPPTEMTPPDATSVGGAPLGGVDPTSP